MPDAIDIAAKLSPLQADALKMCCERGGTRTNDGGLVDDLISSLCSNTAEGITNGWLVKWEMNPNYRRGGYMNLYTPTDLGLAVKAHLEEQSHG